MHSASTAELLTDGSQKCCCLCRSSAGMGVGHTFNRANMRFESSILVTGRCKWFLKVSITLSPSCDTDAHPSALNYDHVPSHERIHMLARLQPISREGTSLQSLTGNTGNWGGVLSKVS